MKLLIVTLALAFIAGCASIKERFNPIPKTNETFLLCKANIYYPKFRMFTEDAIVIVGNKSIPLYVPAGSETKQYYTAIIRIDGHITQFRVKARNPGKYSCRKVVTPGRII